MTGQCQATFKDGTNCPFHAKHHHRTQQGDRLSLCGIHLRTILRRERLGSDEELAARWREGGHGNPLEGSTPSPRI